MGAKAVRENDAVCLLIRRSQQSLNKVFHFRDEIDRNRRKVMEINFFLDNQQIKFEKLTDIGIDVESCIEDNDSAHRVTLSDFALPISETDEINEEEATEDGEDDASICFEITQ